MTDVMMSSSKVVLIVDDDPLVRATIQMQLRNAGFAVMSASDGMEAISACGTLQPDVALVDYRLPGFDGVAVIRRLRDDAGVPAVLLTGMDDAELETEALNAGAVAVLRKPVDGAQLAMLLKRLAGRG